MVRCRAGPFVYGNDETDAMMGETGDDIRGDPFEHESVEGVFRFVVGYLMNDTLLCGRLER